MGRGPEESIGFIGTGVTDSYELGNGIWVNLQKQQVLLSIHPFPQPHKLGLYDLGVLK